MIWMGNPVSVEGPANDLSSVDSVLALVREQGGRATYARRLLLEVLFEASGHLTAEDLATAVQAKAPDVHLSTIYRNLDELQKLGVIVHTHLGHGPATYHLAKLAHCHLVCEECGTIIDVPEDLFRSLNRATKERFGFAVDPRHFAVLGLCERCR
jgi:Fur family transcriptional regulator, ferric uptake regulator